MMPLRTVRSSDIATPAQHGEPLIRQEALDDRVGRNLDSWTSSNDWQPVVRADEAQQVQTLQNTSSKPLAIILQLGTITFNFFIGLRWKQRVKV